MAFSRLGLMIPLGMAQRRKLHTCPVWIFVSEESPVVGECDRPAVARDKFQKRSEVIGTQIECNERPEKTGSRVLQVLRVSWVMTADRWLGALGRHSGDPASGLPRAGRLCDGVLS